MKKILLPLLILPIIAGGIFISCKKEKSCEGCRENNKPPIAVAGPDRVITLPTDSISLDGSASNDPDGTISEWLWTKISGPASFNISSTALAKTLVNNLVAGVYQFELKIKDDKGLFAKDTMQVIVDAVVTTNHPPVANAGADQTITLPTNTVNLDGSTSSDPDNNITGYLWTKISGPSSFNIANPSAVQTPVTNLEQGVYQFELKVTDDKGLFAKDTMQVTVNSASPINRPPVANAGTDKTITLPTNAVNLDGSASTDPDNNISSYQWTKIEGPSSFSIVNANLVTTQATNLVDGTYKVELKVTDADGLVDKDTLRIIVNAEETVLVCGNENRPRVNAQLIRTGTLSEARLSICVAAAGDKILFNSGYLEPDCEGSRKVDIYDIATNTWSVSERPRGSLIGGSGDYDMAVAVAGSKLFFAGGDVLKGCTDWHASTLLTYDAATNKWDSLDNSPVTGLGIAGTSVGNKILFAGGSAHNNRNTVVNIYHLSTNSWSSASLSEGRSVGHAAIRVNNKVYIIGGEGPNGFSSTMDIYDNVTNAWSTGTMQKARAYFGAIAVNDKLYLAGGRKHHLDHTSAICEVEILDLNTGASVIEYLSRPAKWNIHRGQNIVLKDNKIIFLRFDGGSEADKFDIYDINTRAWSIGVLSQAIPRDASVISVNNTVYIAGGFVNGVLSNQVWKLEF